MSQRVLLLGATGQTGSSILNGLLEHGGYEVAALVRPSSAETPKVKAVAERDVKIIAADITGPVDELANILRGFDVVISAIDALSMHLQENLVTAAKQADVKRFVPCSFITVCPPGGVLGLRDEKEAIYQHIRKLHLPYTIVDVGFWHQVTFPTVPSGRADYASMFGPSTTIHAGGNTPTLLTDVRDIGPFVARIISDPRTLNQAVYTWSDVLTENEIFDMMEELSGEKIDRTYMSAETIETAIATFKETLEKEPENIPARLALNLFQYFSSKAIRGDNQPKYAKYLGYLDARELYPDFEPRSFRSFLEEVLDGKAERVYKDHDGAGQLAKWLSASGLPL
ncbi:isoflavone reductase family protein [Aspergillus nomiae NRRL 13137]|uniref:Isoflavone reductase family protein n=1 Tax=Aspergillus nomiae NRRL (strain ATCC 15546 / NRRL 13137 / CBS 260.88 / M93) TaxID=1509407 RepID=A0A0L1IQE5_ASPN3|nr:isoflavone reductase family protein [Aspergillus nomiae NRRL 13137]KNG81811.1 isoflavone reductase family protein [Aspergillus nomiae NRRL 13137]